MHRLGPSLRLRPVNYGSSADLGFLYGVLIQRLQDPDSNISHKTLPSWDEHVAYLRSGAYRVHYLATLGERADFCLGHCYVDYRDCVGVYVQVGFRRHGIAKWMLAELIARHPPPLVANVNPKNGASLRLFRNAGFVMDDIELNERGSLVQSILRLCSAPEPAARPLEPV